MQVFIDRAKPKKARTPTVVAGRAEVSRVVTHTHYTAGGATYGDLDEARAAANGGPVRRCRWFDVMYAGLRSPRFKTEWDVV